MRLNQLTLKQQTIIQNSRKNFFDDEDFEDYKKGVIHALSRKPVRKNLKNSGLAIEVEYMLHSDGYLGLKCVLYGIENKVLWKQTVYYDDYSVGGPLEGYETKSWLIAEVKDLLFEDICDDSGERILKKILG